MEYTERTHKVFCSYKFNLLSNDGQEKYAYENAKKEVIIFLYPSRNKMTMNKIVERNEDNLPIVRTDINEKEWIGIESDDDVLDVLGSL